MDFQIHSLPEGLATQVTTKRPQVGVDALVVFKIDGVSKRLPARHARVRFLTGVDKLMRL